MDWDVNLVNFPERKVSDHSDTSIPGTHRRRTSFPLVVAASPCKLDDTRLESAWATRETEKYLPQGYSQVSHTSTYHHHLLSISHIHHLCRSSHYPLPRALVSAMVILLVLADRLNLQLGWLVLWAVEPLQGGWVLHLLSSSPSISL